MYRFVTAGWVALFWFVSATPARADDAGSFVRSLWLVQRYGTREANDPGNDQRTKGKLARALGKQGILEARGVQGLMDQSTFTRLAGLDGKLDSDETAKLLEGDVPVSRKSLIPALAAHAELLTTSFDMIDETHREAGEKLVDWIVKTYRRGEPLHVTVICTGNSRRSIMGATMGNIAAAYYGMPEVRYHSGGTAPTAFNLRHRDGLKEIGVEIEPKGSEAPRGEAGTANPKYVVRWGKRVTRPWNRLSSRRAYFDAGNPQAGFAALLVCGDADAACPVVKGAAIRISMPYLDPEDLRRQPVTRKPNTPSGVMTSDGSCSA